MRIRSPFPAARDCPALSRPCPHSRARFDEGSIVEPTALHRRGRSERLSAGDRSRFAKSIDRDGTLPPNPTDRPIADVKVGSPARLFDETARALVRLALVEQSDAPHATEGGRGFESERDS